MSGCPCLVFVTRNGTPLGARNVQRDFRKVIDAAGLAGSEWTPRELRRSFVSLLSNEKVPVEVISRMVGHRSSNVTETVYRKQLRPVIEGSSDVMDRLFTLKLKPGR
jgi:integrase